MVYLLLATAGSALISVIMRLSTRRVTAKLSMLCANYFMCLTLAGAFTGFALFPTAAEGFGSTLGMGIFNGALYLTSFILLQYNTGKSGVVLSSVFMKLGLLVPFLLSVIVFRETPTLPHILGFLIAVAAIVLMHFEKGTGEKAYLVPLLALLLLGGSANAMSKVFEAIGTPALSGQFLFYTFCSAFLMCLTSVLAKKERPKATDILWGLLIGIPNFFASKFLLASLSYLPAVVAYPSFSVGTILLITLIGILAFREKLGKRQWIAMAAILAALILLNI